MEKNVKNMEEKIMNKVYRTNREMYKTIRPFVKEMGWERFVIEFKEAVQDYHNDNCGGKFAYIFAIKGRGEVQLVLERDNALWLESLLNSMQTFNDDDMRDKVGDYDFYAIYDKEMANVTTFFEDTRDGDYVKFGNMGWDVEMDVAWFKKIDGLWIACNKAECKKLEKNLAKAAQPQATPKKLEKLEKVKQQKFGKMKNTENAIKERGIKLANELAMEFVVNNIIPQIGVYWDIADEEAKKEMWEKDVEVVKDHTIKSCGVAPTNLDLLGEYIKGWWDNYEKFQTGDWLPNPNLMRKIFRTY